MEHYRDIFIIPMKTFDGHTFEIQCFRYPKIGATPMILYPGFFQSADFWSVNFDDGDFALQLHKQGYDVWTISTRGTGQSTGRSYDTNLDDLAAIDLPQIVKFITEATQQKPILVGHSQGGITSLIYVMGAVKEGDGTVKIDDHVQTQRQNHLQGLVTIGSYPNMTFPGPSDVKDLVEHGLRIKLFGKKITVINAKNLINVINGFNRLAVPIPFGLRKALMNHWWLKVLLFPVTMICTWVALSNAWNLLYYFKTVTDQQRKAIFYRTINASYSGIITQFYHAVKKGRMMSYDQTIDYSSLYSKIKLPISVIGMEFDMIENVDEMYEHMFTEIGSSQKVFSKMMNQGHENFVMNPIFFNEAIANIEKVWFDLKGVK